MDTRITSARRPMRRGRPEDTGRPRSGLLLAVARRTSRRADRAALHARLVLARSL
jgi:hypothetical protein